MAGTIDAPAKSKLHNVIRFVQVEGDIGLAINTWKTKYMEIGRQRGMIANEHTKIGSNSYEKVKTFKY